MRECKKCKSSELTNKNIVMMINECAHPLCKNCVENIFARNAAPCHVCGKTLRKNMFWEQVFDDPLIEKENYIRKKLRKTYNLQQDNFPSLSEFNNYLERFEYIVANLACGIDVDETEAEIKAFAEENADVIERNRRRYDADQEWIMQNLKDEKDMKNRLNEAYQQESAEQKASAVADTKQIIQEIRDSDVAAETILDRERKKQIEQEWEKKDELARLKTRMAQERKRQYPDMSFGVSKRAIGRAYEYQRLRLTINGPELPDILQLDGAGYLQHIRKPSAHRVAGGFTAETGCMRALLESRVDLFLL